MGDLAVAEVCDRFGLGRAVTRGLRLAGYHRNEVWRIDTITGAYAVKRLGWAPSDIAIEIERAALAAGVPMPVPVQETATGRYAAEIDGGVVRVHRWMDGRAPGAADLTPALARRMGALLSAVHRAGSAGPARHAGTETAHTETHTVHAGAETTHTETHTVHAETETTHTEAHTVQAGAETAQAEGRSRAVAPYPADELLAATERPAGRGTPVRSHGDLHPKNALLRSDGSLALLDWDTAGGYLAEREAVGVALDWATRVDGSFDLERFDAAVEGYGEGGGKIPAEPWVFGGWARGYLDFLGRAGEEEGERTRARLGVLATSLPDLVKRLA